jgi:hypothetical protein
MSDPSTDETFVEQLREAGERVEKGHFEVDPRKAQQKLQKFQLADPHRYVLQFIQTAHLLGAEWIEIYIDADEVELHFDGEPLRDEELESIHAAAFQKRRGDRARALRHLAIGLTTAREVDPERIVVQSARVGDSGVRLTIDELGESALESGGGPTEGTTRIYLKEAYRDHHLVEFFKKFTGDLVEEKLVREQCRFARVDIELNGERVDQGLYLPEETVGQVSFETEEDRGVLGFRDPGSMERHEREVAGEVKLVQHGVLVCGYVFSGSLSVLEPYAVIASDRLTKNLSQSGFVRDEAWQDLTDRVLPRVAARSIRMFVGELDRPIGREYRGWLLQVAVELWASGAERESGPEAELAECLAGLPIWPAACKPPDEVESRRVGRRHYVSLEAIRSGDQPVLYADEVHLPDAAGSFDRPVLQTTAHLPPYQEPVRVSLPEELYADGRNVTDQLEMVEKRRANKQEWEDGEQWSSPNQVSFPHRHEAEPGAYSCGAYVGDRTGESALVYVKQGRRFDYRSLAEFPVPECQLVVAGDLPVDETWEEVVVDGAIREAIFELVAALPGLVADSRVSGAEFMEARLDSDLLAKLFGKLGLEQPGEHIEVFLEWIHQRDFAEWVGRFWDLGPGALESVAPLRTGQVRARFGALGESPVIRSLTGERLSLIEIAEAIAEDGKIRCVEVGVEASDLSARGAKARWVEESHRSARPLSFEEWRREYEQARVDAPVLTGGGQADALLEAAFGEAVESGNEWLLGESARQAFLDEAPPATDLGEFDDVECIEGDGYEVRIGLEADHDTDEDSLIGFLGAQGYTSPGTGSKMQGRVWLEVAYRGHRLAEHELDVPAGHFRAVARGAVLTVEDDWTDVVRDETYREIVDQVKEAALDLLTRRCARVFGDRDVSDAELLAFWRAVATAGGNLQVSDLRHVSAFEVVGEGWTSHSELSVRLLASDVLQCVSDDNSVLESALVDEQAPVVRAPNNTDTHELLDELFPVDRVVDVTDNDFQRDALERRQREFRQKPERAAEVRRGDLPVGIREPIVCMPLEADGLRGGIALAEVGGERTGGQTVREIVLHERRVLDEETCTVPFGHWVAVCAADWLEPMPDYRGLRDGRRRLERSLREQAAAVVERLVQKVAAADPDESRRERQALLAAVDPVRSAESVPSSWESTAEKLQKVHLFEGLEGRRFSAADLVEAVGQADNRLCVVDEHGVGNFDELEPCSAGVPVVTTRGFEMRVEALEQALEKLVGEVEFVEPSSIVRDDEQTSDPFANLSEMEQAIIARFLEVCGEEHDLYEALPKAQMAFAETAGEVVRLDPDGVRLSREHPAVEFLCRHVDTRSDENGSAVEVVPLALVVSSLYTVLSREVGGTGGWEDREFYAQHISAVAETFDNEE